MYPVELLKLQIDFAKRASEIEHINISLALLRYSPIARFVGIKYSEMSVENPLWVELIELLHEKSNSVDQAVAIAEFKKTHHLNNEESFDIDGNPRAEFGCFNFDYQPEKKQIQIHFSNNDKGETGPLSKERMPERIKELTAMFKFIKDKHPQAEVVRGHSWLYSIDAYKRLFPLEYVASGVIKQTFLNTSMWGQFVDKSGNLKNHLAQQFEKCIKTKNTMEELANCFPHQQPKVSANVQIFYDFYHIS